MRIIFSPYGVILVVPTPVNITATVIYQTASITPAVIPINTVSVQLESVCTKWLNIAKKNKAIFGLKIDIKNPSRLPLINIFDSMDLRSDCLVVRLVLLVKVRNPIYAIRNAPNAWTLTNKPDISTMIFEIPIAVKSAHKPMPVPCPTLVATPYILPLSIVLPITRAKLGPGEIAPRKHTKTIWSQLVISIMYDLEFY